MHCIRTWLLNPGTDLPAGIPGNNSAEGPSAPHTARQYHLGATWIQPRGLMLIGGCGTHLRSVLRKAKRSIEKDTRHSYCATHKPSRLLLGIHDLQFYTHQLRTRTRAARAAHTCPIPPAAPFAQRHSDAVERPACGASSVDRLRRRKYTARARRGRGQPPLRLLPLVPSQLHRVRIAGRPSVGSIPRKKVGAVDAVRGLLFAEREECSCGVVAGSYPS
ncbi:hypothetical protein C8Q77DRAFT_89895 [Trametes polyzona]|nr:hypothetical protein C8Q77DRAFT_89895 [Trametes polyzona]